MGLLDKFGKSDKKEATQKPRMGELAANESQIYGSGVFTKYNPDTLVGRKGLQIYDKMRIDDTVKSSLILKKYAVLAPYFRIVPASDQPEDIRVADFLEYCFANMEGSIYDSILQILTALDYGYSVTEINYEKISEGEFNGMIGLKSLKTKHPHYFEFDVDKYSNIRKNGLIETVNANHKKLPTRKFIIFSYQKEFGNPYGNSDLRSAYRGYWSKDVLIKFWNIYLERFAMPTVIGKYASNDSTSIGNLRQILDNLSAKTSISHRMGEFDISLLESSRNQTAEYQAAINTYNKMIARSILIPDRLFAEGETGAYAQSKIHFDVFVWVVEKLRQDIEEIVMKEQLLRRLIGWNFSNVSKLPSFKFNPLTDEQKLELNNMFINAVQKGVINKNMEDENYIRESLNFPIKRAEATDKIEISDEVDEVIEDGKPQEEVEINSQRFHDEVLPIVLQQRDLLREFIVKKYDKDELNIGFIKSGIDLKKKQAIKDEIKKSEKDNPIVKEYDNVRVDVKIEKYFDDHLSTIYLHLLDCVGNNNELDEIVSGIDKLYEGEYVKNLENLMGD